MSRASPASSAAAMRASSSPSTYASTASAAAIASRPASGPGIASHSARDAPLIRSVRTSLRLTGTVSPSAMARVQRSITRRSQNARCPSRVPIVQPGITSRAWSSAVRRWTISASRSRCSSFADTSSSSMPGHPAIPGMPETNRSSRVVAAGPCATLSGPRCVRTRAPPARRRRRGTSVGPLPSTEPPEPCSTTSAIAFARPSAT
jgi:hypothetical protein